MNENEVIGSVLGQGRRAEEILIVSSVDKTGTLRNGTIIAHDTINETILFQVANKITWTNISEQDLYLMNENERLTYQIIQKSPKSYILRCHVVGSIRDEGGGPQTYTGTTSYVADTTPNIRHLNRAEQKMIYDRGVLSVGHTLDGSVVTLPINALLQRHLSIIGMTGCGKSYLLGLLCEELAAHQAAIFIIDPHNEYIPMVQSMPIDVGRMLYSVDPIIGLNTYTLDVKEITAEDFQHFTGMGEGSTSILENVIQTLKRENAEYTIFDILTSLDAIAQGRSSSEATAALWARNYLRGIARKGFIGTKEPPIKEMVRANQISVVAMSGVQDKIQQFVVTNLLQRIFAARKENEISPLVLIVEEAHRFSPAAEMVSSSSILRTLAAEGRKFGICLVVVSQRPNRLDSTVLSQCVTNIVMKTKNPVDLASIRDSAENVTEDILRELPKFERGEALIMGEAFPVSIRFVVRSDRKTKHGGKNVDFKGAWVEKLVNEETKRYEFPDELGGVSV